MGKQVIIAEIPEELAHNLESYLASRLGLTKDRLSFRDRWIQFLKDNPEVAKATGHDNYLD